VIDQPSQRHRGGESLLKREDEEEGNIVVTWAGIFSLGNRWTWHLQGESNIRRDDQREAGVH